MRKNKGNKPLSWIMAAVMAVSAFSYCNVSVNAQESLEEKQYIIIAADEQAYEETEQEIHDDLTVETPVLSENHVMVAELTEIQAEALANDENIMIEEDIIINASSAEGTAESDGEDAPVNQEAIARKEEVKRRKDEIFAELQEQGEAGQEAGYEWNLQAINADGSVTEERAAGSGVKVAVLDSGVDYVSGINLAGFVNFVEEEQEISPMFQDMTGHGTAIASIISGNGEDGMYGVNPNAEVYSVKVLDEGNQAPLSRIIRGIYWCIEHEIRIINMSFGTPIYSQALEQAVLDAYKANILMVAAAGNGSGDVEYPAAFPQVLAVAATSPEAEISDFSNTGEELDVAAPGERILAASFFNGSMVTHGTSIAVPHVTGVASLLWEKDPQKDHEFIRQLIRHSAKNIEGTEECGLLDAGYAMESYDAFAESYVPGEGIEAAQIPENTEEPEGFASVETDEAYVEGRWNGKNHKAAADKGNAVAKFTAAEINVIKQGIVYPDNDDDLRGGKQHSRWHGKWEDHYRKELMNYVAVFEMVTTIAVDDGASLSSYKYSDFMGMDEKTFGELIADIAQLRKKYATILKDNTKRNQKLFLFGCGLHTMTDVFAHSTTDKYGVLIKHDGATDDNNPDNIDYYPGRYKVAVKATEYSLLSLKEDVCGDGYEILEALNAAYKDKAVFKIIRIKSYMRDNGYTDPVLQQATIATPK
ncbi:S8 family serine peptidase [Lachnospiraceae bacterium 29-84]